MTRGVPLIKRVRETRYQTSDGLSFESHARAFKHETYVQLAAFLEQAGVRNGVKPNDLARALLEVPDFRIVLLGPRVPASRQEGGAA